MITEGAKAPDFKLEDETGKVHTLADYSGRKLVIFFYPKDNTPGCTKESCAFRDFKAEFGELNCDILGVSANSAESHQKFIDLFDLNFPLLVDGEKELMDACGAWGEKMNYGKKYMGIIRSTMLIGEDGTLLKHWPKVARAADHPANVLEHLKSL